MAKRITEWRPTALGRLDRQRLRWEDVRAGLGKMKIKNLSRMAMVRKAWKKIFEQVKTHEEL